MEYVYGLLVIVLCGAIAIGVAIMVDRIRRKLTSPSKEEQELRNAVARSNKSFLASRMALYGPGRATGGESSGTENGQRKSTRRIPYIDAEFVQKLQQEEENGS